MPITPAPKPERAPLKKRLFSSIVDSRTFSEKTAAQQKLRTSSRVKTRNPKPIARRNKKRQAVEFARTFGSRERVLWVKSLPCLACLLVDTLYGWGKVENCHVTDPGNEKGGSRRANHRGIVPMCRGHHVRFDRRLAPFNDPAQREYIERQAERIAAKWDAEGVA